MSSETVEKALHNALLCRVVTSALGMRDARAIIRDLMDRGYVIAPIDDHVSLLDAAEIRAREKRT